MFFSEDFNQYGTENLSDYLGINITQVSNTEVHSELAVQEHHMASNGFLHTGSIVTLADTSCSHGCIANLPNKAIGFKTIEVKSSQLDTTRDGYLNCIASVVYLGQNKQVWEAIITHRESGKTIALFQCTLMILYEQHSS